MSDDLAQRLAAAGHRTPTAAWRPQRFVLPRDADALAALLDAHPHARVHDRIAEQVAGLLETRDPPGTVDPAVLQALARDRLGDAPETYGAWFWFPWSDRLVHVLPADEFRELRTSRNRNKITAQEQATLQGLHIGIVGLSIGQAAAVTLTLEGIGGLLVLADFDHLELSNLNRLRAGVHGLGTNKAVLAAREVFEIDPWSTVTVWTEAVTADNVEAFLQVGGRPLDLVYEECDDLATKILVRQHARAQRIPVLMETSDRGLMDIERFDLEPDRPIFHGLLGEVDPSTLTDMTNHEKVPLVMRIIGREAMSDRMAASMVDIDATLASWPQLASEVALGAGINVDTARRIALGELSASGRFYVDVHATIDDATRSAAAPAPPAGIVVSAEARHVVLPPLRGDGRIDTHTVRTLVDWATTAFSGGNCQPWRFHHHGRRVSLIHDTDRSESFLDVDHRASYVAFGSVLENVAMVAPVLGLQARFALFPDADDPTRICDIDLDLSDPVGPTDPLVQVIAERVTNRQLGPRVALDPAHRGAMGAEAAAHGGTLRWVEGDEALDRAGVLIGRADRLRLLNRTMHGEMMGELRWDVDAVERTRDGLDLATLELTRADLAGFRMVSQWPVMRTVGQVGGGAGLERPSRKSVAAASALGLLTVDGLTPADFVRGGRALHRVWLRATALGLALQPMTSVTYLFHRLLHADARGLAPHEVAALQALRTPFCDLFSPPTSHGEVMLFRVAVAPPPSARSLRLHVDQVLRSAG